MKLAAGMYPVDGSKDVYFDITYTGVFSGGAANASINIVEVANGAATPAVTAHSLRLWKVVTNATQITSVTLLAPTQPILASLTQTGVARSKSINPRATSPLAPLIRPAWTDLALAVITRCLDDLRSPQRNVAKDAAYAISQHWLEPWLERLPANEIALARVRRLLQDELSRGRALAASLAGYLPARQPCKRAGR